MSGDRPALRVVRGEPSDEEVAALVAALTVLSASGTSKPPPRSRWADRASLVRAPLRPGPGAWRASAR